MEIRRGDVVQAKTAGGDVIRMRALGAPQQGHDFPVVWVCTEGEWNRADAAGDEPDGLPWPLTAIAELEDA
jgi:hypothetical protein